MRFLLCFFLALLVQLPGVAARLETIDVPSAAMNKTYRANVILPDSYDKNQATYPVLYLLHGAYGHYGDWLNNTPDKTLVPRLADENNLVIVMPEGETFSFYLDSPMNPSSRFETYIIREVIPVIDASFRTIASKKGRVITGLSMGGGGSLYLATRNSTLFCAAGSMSGAVDIATLTGYTKDLETILGPKGATPDFYATNAVINMVDKMKANALPLIFDCGVDDFLLSYNRDLHQRLVAAKVPHDYTERPGEHTWEYWQNALPYQVLYFEKVLKANGSATATP